MRGPKSRKFFPDVGPRTSDLGHELAGFLNFPRTEAAGTDVYITGNSADEGVDAMSVRELSPFRHVVGVADVVGYVWTLATHFTSSLDPGHPGLLPIAGSAALRTQPILLNAS